MKSTHTSLNIFFAISGMLFLTACSTAHTSIEPNALTRESTRVLELRTRMSSAADVFARLAKSQEINIPDHILKRAHCVAVLPDVVQAAFFAGGKYGHGVVSCRNEKNQWSAPAFVTLGGASFGLQAGANKAALVLFFMDESARRSLVSNSFNLGGDIGVSAGPVGRATAGATDLELTGILSYSVSQGLFAGVSLQGAVFAPDKQANVDYYGREVSMDQLVLGDEISIVPLEAQRLLESLPSHVG